MGSLIAFQIETTAEEAEAEKKASAGSAEYEVKSVKPLPRGPDSPMVEARFIDPVTLTVSATLATIAIRLVNHWLKRDERGVQIDLRTQPPTISQLQNVPAGVMVIIGKDGKATVKQQAYDKPEDVLPTLTGLFAAKPAQG